MRALLLYGNAFSGHAFGLHGNLTPPRITPRRPPLLRRLTSSESLPRLVSAQRRKARLLRHSSSPPLPIKSFDSAGSPSMLQRSTSGLDASIFNASACHGLRCGCAAPTESGAPIRRPAHSACRFPDSRRKVKNALYNSVVKGRLSFRKVKGQEERVLAFLACIGTKTRFRGVSQSNFFQKASSFFLASLSDSLTLYSETPSIFAISFAVRFSA